jgi:hypothetical protein
MPIDTHTYEVDIAFRAGAYPTGGAHGVSAPGAPDLEQAGITLFVDLTVAGELPGYATDLLSARHLRRPIPDMSVTTSTEMAATLDAIDEELSAGGGVYVHCWAGLGRTGTVVGCWLRRHERDAGDPIARIAALRTGLYEAWTVSPQTEEQRSMVRRWPRNA